MNQPIPVLGTAIVNGVHWLKRQWGSIDYPVDRYIVINNNGRGEIDRELDDLIASPHAYIKQRHVVHVPSNLGCPGAWNLIIKSSIISHYWILVGNDVAFLPNALQKFALAAQDTSVGMVHGAAGEHGVGGYSFFSVRDWVIQQYGLFDENFYPAYAEDLDYVMRTHHSVKKVMLEIPYLHGAGSAEQYGQQGSNTWRTDMSLKNLIDRGREINETEYLSAKWGPEWPSLRPWTHPWNDASLSTAAWGYDLGFVRRKHLGF